MEYISITQTSSKWNISRRRINTLCLQRRIPHVTRIRTVWAIPADAEKPNDARIKSRWYIKLYQKGRAYRMMTQ